MNRYEIHADEYFHRFNNESDSKKVKETMEQLIEKYGLANKRALCVAPGSGIEEYWFYKHGCHLTFVDIDQYGSIEPVLKQHAANASSPNMTYYIGDASQFTTEVKQQFDVLYISGITNDESRRRKILEENSVWPLNEMPYMDFIPALAMRGLRAGGLFIYQSYYGGVNALYNKHYIGLVEKQLAQAGVILINYYVFNEAHSVSLTVGLKGSGQDADDYLRQIKHHPELMKFHGRSELSRQGIQKVYDRLQ